MADYLALIFKLLNLSMIDFLKNKYDWAKSYKVAKLIVKYKYHLSGIEFFQLTRYMNKKDDFDAAWFLATSGYFFTLEELNSFIDHRLGILYKMAEHGFEFTVDEIFEIDKRRRVASTTAKNVQGYTTEDILKIMAKHGHEFTIEEILKIDTYFKPDDFSFSLWLVSNFHKFNFDDLIKLGNPVERFGASLAHRMAEHGFEFTLDEIFEIDKRRSVACTTVKNVQRYTTEDILKIMAKHGHEFTIEEILKIDQYFEPDDFTFSLWLVSNFHKFNFDDLIKLGNPEDRFGASLAHWMAFNGYRFSLQELNIIGSLVISYTKKHLCEEDIIFGGWYDLNENETYQQKRYILHNGATVAHIMAREGYQFTDEEIEQLGNPKDSAGLTIKDWMHRCQEQKLTRK
jgi:hypothetical protein